MRIDIGTTKCRVSEYNDNELAWLKNYLVFEVEGARFTPAYKHGYWDGKIKLFYKGDLFPVGLLKAVMKAAKEKNFETKVYDRRVPPCIPDPDANIEWLRPYQRTAVKIGIDNKNGIFWVATGAGKTEIFCALSKCLGCRWLFVAHRKELMYQAAERFENRTGEKPGLIGDGHWDTEHRVTFATFQTLSKALDRNKGKPEEARAFLAQMGGLCVDEAHTLGADSFWEVAMACNNAYYRFGLSGTPLARGDKRSIFTVAAMGPIIWRLRATTLVDAGVLAKPSIKMFKCTSKFESSDWHKIYRKVIVENKERNKLICDMVMKAEKPCLVFVKQSDHGQKLTDALRHLGLNASFVFGKNNTLQRKEAIKQLERADLDVLVCSVIFQEGVDIPDLRSVVIASGGKSTIATIQMLGRGMRKAKGKETFEVWDVMDRGAQTNANGRSKSLPTTTHARERYNSYVAEGHKVEILEEV